MLMTDDIRVLTAWIFVCVVIASIGTTAVPILYAFFPWRLRPIGKLFMLQSISFALAIDLTALFLVWPLDNVQVLFWINALVFTFIALTTASMATWLLRMLVRLCKHNKRGKQDGSGQQDVQPAEVPGADRAAGSGDPLRRDRDDLGSPEGA